MSLIDLVDNWGAVESDFARFYKVEQPLDISWRRFNVLLFNLITQESAFFAPFLAEAREEAEQQAEWEKYKRGDRANIPRESVPLDQALGEIGIGK